MAQAQKNNTNISIIIPLYNEEETIQEILKNTPNHFPYEIIIVNDGSTDESVKRIKEVKFKNLKLISHKKNKGYGAALLTGFNRAKGDIIVTLDSDGQHDPQEIPRLIRPILLNQTDLAIGSRYLGNCHYTVPFHTRFGECLINIFLKLFYHQKVENNQSGFRSFRRKYLALFKNMNFSNFGFCTELLFKAVSRGLKITEIPINVKPRKYGKSYVKLFKLLITISACVFTYGLKKFRLIHIIPKFIRHIFLKVS
jgi:glycosyltransferase involved in cell wall biosynthesis